MDTKLRKSAHKIIDALPDDIDFQLIKEAMCSNEEETYLDDLAEELGFSVDELRS